MYTDILYPTDGSAGAGAALTHCRTLAQTYGATVHVLYVAERPVPHGLSSDVEAKSRGGTVGSPKGSKAGMVGSREKPDEIRASIKEYGTDLLADVVDRFDDVETETALQTGNPYEVILDYTKDHAVDLVVMGTHGRTGLDRYLIGSVTEKVVRMSDVPVLTVRQPQE